MKTIEEILDLPTILDRLHPFAMTELGKKLCVRTTFFRPEELADKLHELDEAMQLLRRFGSWPIYPVAELRELFHALQKGRMLHLEDLNHLRLDGVMIEELGNFQKTLKVAFPHVEQWIDSLDYIDGVYGKIRNLINDRGQLVDHASPALLSIRKQLKRMDAQMVALIQKLVSTYASSLTESTYSVRNGQYVLPVITSQKQKVPGVIEDVSDTGLTTFVQPLPIVQLQQEKQALLAAEQDEIFVILTGLTETIQPYIDTLALNNKTLGYLDYLHAKARFGIVHEGHASILVTEPGLKLKGARHLLIDPEKVIKNDFELTEKQAIIIISGPNAGGKTVAMKTIGVSVCFHQLAIPLLTDDRATLSYFHHVYADIGDTQSVLENLSTFAGHMTQLVPLTEKVKPFDLVLIDELGTGTDPQEGEALARSLLLHLQAKRAFVVVSSHFPGLKTLALEQPRMINASLVFDEEKLQPTYQFRLGYPGKSYGLVMAKRYGLAPKVVEFAEKYLLEKEQTPEQKTLKKLQEQLAENDREKDALKTLQAELKQTQLALEKERQTYQQKRAALEEDVKVAYETTMFNVKKKLDETIKQLANPELKLHEAIALKAELDALLDEDGRHEETAPSPDLEVDDYVEDQETMIRGKIVAIQKQKVMMITEDGLTVSVNASRLEVIPPPQEKTVKVKNTKPFFKKAPSSINIIGLRYEEAKLAIEHYHDQAILSQLKTLKIIHGFGSGTLRKLVFDYFSQQEGVIKIGGPEGEQAGYGVTVVTFQ